MSDTTRAPRRLGANQAIPLAAAAVGGVFLWLGLSKYGFWSPATGPMPGFVPIVVSAAMIAVAALAFVFSWKEAPVAWPRESWLAVLGGAAILGGTLLIGMLPSVALYLVIWLRLLERSSWKTTLLSTAIVMAIVIGAFVLWLGVQFPRGLLFDALFR